MLKGTFYNSDNRLNDNVVIYSKKKSTLGRRRRKRKMAQDSENNKKRIFSEIFFFYICNFTLSFFMMMLWLRISFTNTYYIRTAHRSLCKKKNLDIHKKEYKNISRSIVMLMYKYCLDLSSL